MFQDCEEIISKVKLLTKSKKVVWNLQFDGAETFLDILKNEAKLLVDVGMGDSVSTLEFSLADHTTTDEYMTTRKFKSLNGKLIKRGLGSSSSFNIGVQIIREKQHCHLTQYSNLYFGDKDNPNVVIIPELIHLSSERKRMPEETFVLYSQHYASENEIILPLCLKIGIIVAPIACTTGCKSPSKPVGITTLSELNIPIDLSSQNFESLSQQLGQFFSDEEENYSDIKIVSRDGMIHRAHRFVLAARSKTIHELMEESMKSNTFNGTISDFDMDAKALIVFLQWIYTGKLSGVTEKNLDDLVNAAVRFELTEMLKLLDGQLIKLCNPENMLRLFQVAKQNELESAKKDIPAFIKENIG